MQVRLSEVDWDEGRDGREGEAQLDMLRAQARAGTTPAAVAAQAARPAHTTHPAALATQAATAAEAPRPSPANGQ